MVTRGTVDVMRIDHDGISLHVAEDGDPAAPPLLLLHGITSSGATWNWIVPELAERYRVLRLDFRGHGASDRAPGAYTLDGYVGDAAAVIEQAAGRECVVIGHSLGGATAAVLTQRHADLVVAAVMEDPPLMPPVGNGPEAGAGVLPEDSSLLQSFRMIRETAPQFQSAGMTADVLAGGLATAPAASGGTFGDLLHPDGITAMAEALLTFDASVLDPVLDGTARSFVDPTTPFGAPSLIVCADPAKPDAIADPDLARRLASISPAVEVTTVDGAGHLIHDELGSRDTFRTLVAGFLAGS